ncbi:MAG TPA: NADH-quinone oxidoreductase subunit A [bacterium]|nr:NADH-quinone oxidoreductase subunit A [bacterium]
MLFNFANVLIFLLVACGFVFVSLTLGHILRPKVPFPEKLTTYECGELPAENAWVNFNMRFYLLALLFIIFDVEIAFMFPVGAVFKQWIRDGHGVLALTEIAVFVGILLLGLVYAWTKGDLEWIKTVEAGDKNIGLQVMPRSSKV